MENADTLVLLGTQFPYRAFYPAKANIIQIDLNPSSIGSHCHVDMALLEMSKQPLMHYKRLKKTDTAHLMPR